MRKLLFMGLFLFFGYSQKGVPSAWTPDNVGVHKPEIEVTLKIKQMSFYMDQPIIVDLYIKNINNNEENITLRFKKKLIENLELSLVDEKNTRINPSMNYLAELQRISEEKNNQYLYQFNRELDMQTVDLSYGETFVTHLNLNNFFELNEGAGYFLTGNFIIFLPINENNTIKINYPMNRISFKLEGSISDNKSDQSDKKGSIKDALKPNMPPYEVVQQFLKSQQEKNWEIHLMTVNLFDLLSNSYSSSHIYEQFISAEPSEKEFVLSEFKDMLIQSYNYKILSFNISETSIKKNKAIVKVDLVTRQNIKKWTKNLNENTLQVKEEWVPLTDVYSDSAMTFVFSLENQNNYWKIVKKDALMQSKNKINSSAVEEQPLNAIATETFYFDSGSYEIKPEFYSTLQGIKDYVLLNPNYKVYVKGFTDIVGDKVINDLLSKKRALRIKQYMVDRLGINANNINIEWYGKNDPASTKDELNRRVEVEIK